MSTQPLVSIIIPTYNRAHLIGETLDSVLAQTYTNWECIIVDDGSTDHTDEVVGAYVQKDSRFKYYHRPEEHLPGGNGARNYGFKMSQGEYVNWLDSDDLFAEDKIEKQVLALKESNDSVSTCKWGRFNTKEKYKLKNLDIFKDFKTAYDIFSIYGHSGFFPSMVFLSDRNIFNESGLWDENLIINQDGEFFCRVILEAKSIFFAKDTYALYRQNTNGNTSSYSSKEKAESSIKSWKLTERHLVDKKVNGDNYISHAKFFIYQKIKRNYPELIGKHCIFFEKQIRYYSFFRRLKRKLGNYLNIF